MHNIQRKILEKLLYAEALGYAQIRPAGVESNHFAYHLEQLVKAGIIAKQDKRYSLTPAGLALVDRLSQEKMIDRVQPHIVTAIRLENNNGEVLLYKRNFQPYFHRIGLLVGKTHYEETIQHAAIRELEEKSGIINVPLTHRGMAYVEAIQQGTSISKVLYHFFTGTTDAQPQQTNPKRGECYWGDPAAQPANELMPGFAEAEKLIDSHPGTLFFAEITTDLSAS